jgi:hypothetical protein
MASVLQVEELRGPTSGANANKVIIPSGQTFDVTNGTVIGLDLNNDISIADLPAGSVVHCEQQKGTDTFTSTASSWVTSGVSFNYTPKESGNLIVCQVQVNVWRSSTSAYFGVRVVNSGGYNGTVATYGDGYYSDGGAISWDTTYQFKYTSTSTSQVTHTFQVHPNGGSLWFPNNSPVFSTDSRWVATIWEVKQ